MKLEESKKVGRHIKVQKLRNSEMRAARGGAEYSCGSAGDDDCKKLIIHLEQAAYAVATDLLSVYR